MPDRERADARPEAPEPEPVYCTCTDSAEFCRVRVLTEAEWAQTPEAERPERARHAPGLGWVVAFTVAVLN